MTESKFEALYKNKVHRTEIPAIPNTCNAPISGPINLSGKVALITGAARGLGEAIAYALSREGAVVVLTDIITCNHATKEITEQGGNAVEYIMDVTNKDDIKRVVQSIINEWGQIDILVNNAGICDRTIAEDITEREWNANIDVDLKGTFLVTQAVWPMMKKRKSGKVLCIGSIAGRVGGVIAGPHYVAAKAGVHGMIKWFAKDGAPYGIYINAIAPGPVWTAMTLDFPYTDDVVPLGRVGRCEDIAEVAVFLCSDMSNYITGCVIDVNGGMFMS
jgi:NAD(P)-dependent dehydrogenase (short-subunit alcohol dehydrogenase family)